MDWVDLSQSRDRWRTLVHLVMDLGFHKMREISRIAKNCLASQKGLRSLELVIWFQTERKVFPVEAKSAHDKTAINRQHFRFRQLSV